jgi:hypothetical protein
MSNPCINRWGLNTFWHHFWYTDFDYASGHKQDYAFSTLVTLFIFHGVGVTVNVFANTYWYSHAYASLTIPHYRRFITRKSIKYDKLLSFDLRKEADAVFPMKLWILKYSHWFIINQYWFRPLKRYKLPAGWENPDHLDSVSVIKKNKRKDWSTLRKAKILFSKNFLRRMLNSDYYKF